MKLHKVFFLLLLPLIIHSCARYVNTTTNTFADRAVIPQGFARGSSFAIIGAPQENVMFSKEVSHKIAKILQEGGYHVTDAEHANYCLKFDYKMTGDTRTIQVPTYIPGPSETTKGNVCSSEGELRYQEEKQSSGTVIYTPQDITLFTRELSINVYDRNNQEQVWQGFASSTGNGDDLRDVMDYLLVSAFNYFGQNTKKNLDARVSCKNPVVKWLKT